MSICDTARDGKNVRAVQLQSHADLVYPTINFPFQDEPYQELPYPRNLDVELLYARVSLQLGFSQVKARLGEERKLQTGVRLDEINEVGCA